MTNKASFGFNVPFSGSGTLNKKQMLNTIPV